MIYGGRKVAEPIRWGMVGGGRGSLIGYIHRCAALRDRNFDLVAGALDLDPERGRTFGRELGIAPERCYPNHAEMFAAEAARPEGIRAVSVTTPNNTHHEITKAALEAGLHVVCEKPLTVTVAQAEELQALARAKGRIVGVAYGYSGYQMIEQARAMVEAGELGRIRLVNMQFAHGYHSAPLEERDPAIRWRVDPSVVGPSYVLGDLATHPLYLSRLICPQLAIRRLMCARQSFVASRAPLEDNAVVLMEYEGGAFGQLWTSAVNAGSMHSQKIRIVGETASLEWWDEQPNQLRHEVQGEPVRILERNMGYLHAGALTEDRIGAGHPEGLFEAWANIYDRFAQAMEAAEQGDARRLAEIRYPDIEAGVHGVRWVASCVRSADAGGVWVDWA